MLGRVDLPPDQAGAVPSATAVAAAFGLGTPIAALDPADRAWSPAVYRLDTGHGSYARWAGTTLAALHALADVPPVQACSVDWLALNVERALGGRKVVPTRQSGRSGQACRDHFPTHRVRGAGGRRRD